MLKRLGVPFQVALRSAVKDIHVEELRIISVSVSSRFGFILSICVLLLFDGCRVARLLNDGRAARFLAFMLGSH